MHWSYQEGFRMIKKAHAVVMAIAALALLAQPAITVAEGDDFKSCARCHGEDGNSTKSSSPSIAGLSAAYGEHALRAFRDGERECGASKMKCRMAAKWTDEEIVAASAHFAQFERVAPEQSFDSALAEQGKAIHQEKCAGCHSAEASSAPDAVDGGMLNGQWREYLEYSLEQYAGGGRQQPDDMRAALESLDEAQKDAVLHYYASGL
jgi:sulfide dehydrogenase cytochrome subunit